MIVKYVQPDRSGIQAHNFTRHSIGYVVRGKKCVYYGDVCHEIPQGTLFYMGMGNHYTEDVPNRERTSSRSSSTILPISCRGYSTT